VAVAPNGEYAYVANYGSGTVSVINTATNTAPVTITVGTDPKAVAVTPDGAYVYVTLGSSSLGSGSVSVINTATYAVTTVTGVSNPFGVAVTPNSEYAYVTNEQTGTVSVISTGSPTSSSTAVPTTTPTVAPTPKIPEFPVQLLGITLVVSLIIVLSVVIIAKKRKTSKIQRG
jgi:YVTN family beta-propeller protein